ncbi:histidinol-phosphate transaminase [Trichothermofontia sichuanensis B231]|uniref:histidinol-phosphate transaminase n=1 Tax=Trichothermofontia sichuanensis TaxID=3045816 RepID=UPI00224653AD|nr:histidinol-phosphate transaminase [Trichothermofontia sichuanensis]UZQ54877.1 histidinol-phosphate transaminase [Trichothermofontia sichuanensis B231]
MLKFIRPELAQLVAYAPHPEGASAPDTLPDFAPVATLDQLNANESPYDLPLVLKQKLAWAYQQELATNRYPDSGHAALKQAIADYVRQSSGAAITAEQISVGNGSDELIRSLLIATCLGGQGAILVADPTFVMYRILAETLGIPVVAVGRSETTFAMDLTAAQSALVQTQAPPIRVVFVVHPNSPTANLLTEAEITWLRQLPEHILVVIDEAYFEFSQHTLVSELAQHPNWVILRTFSKALRLASHRVGYAIAAAPLTVILEKVRLPYNLPAASQAAALVALQHREQLLSVIPSMLTARSQILATLAHHPQLQVWPSAANFVYLRLRPEALVSQTSADGALARLTELLKRQGTLVRQISGGLRVTIGTPEENQRFLERLAIALAHL